MDVFKVNSRIIKKGKLNLKFTIYSSDIVHSFEVRGGEDMKAIIMLTGSKIIGDSHVGENSLITEGTIIRNENIPANSVVYGESPNLVIKKRNEENK